MSDRTCESAVELFNDGKLRSRQDVGQRGMRGNKGSLDRSSVPDSVRALSRAFATSVHRACCTCPRAVTIKGSLPCFKLHSSEWEVS
jgi:hypothetical protein